MFLTGCKFLCNRHVTEVVESFCKSRVFNAFLCNWNITLFSNFAPLTFTMSCNLRLSDAFFMTMTTAAQRRLCDTENLRRGEG